MKFFRKPVEAEQFTNESKDRCFNMCNGQARAEKDTDGKPFMRINGPQGAQNVALGDWVVRDGFDLYGYTNAEFQLKFAPETTDCGLAPVIVPQLVEEPGDFAIAARTLFRWWHRRRAATHDAKAARFEYSHKVDYHIKWRDYRLARLADFK